ncbi:MAG: tetratricopeptide repeat protein, partial [Bacteroidota bacterium]
MNNKKLSAFILLALIVFISACSGGKKGSKLSLLGRFYHNTTARYNGYYYGKLKLNRVKEGMTSSLQDDYTKLLPLFTDEQAGSGSKGDLDSVIIKLSVVTQLHPKSKWVDDCYLLMGESYFYKQDYDDALSTFQYIVGTFKETGKKKKSSGGKKIKEGDVTIPWLKQGNGLSLQHKPVRNEALLWLLKSYIAMKKYDEAQSIIKVLAADNSFPFDLRDEFTLISTQLYLKQERYADAISPLKQAIVLTKKKKDKTRYTYILAQLYQLSNNSDKAIESFKKVIAMKPEYKMEFYANINIAKSFSGNGKTSATEVLALLEKLARDDKFEEFRDQIYYTMAEVYLKQNDRPSAVTALNKSIETSTTNANQKAMSFLKLAELDFGDKKYVTAAKFYDSTAVFMTKSLEKYDEVNDRKKTLDNLVFQLNIVSREDSLQKLAAMPEKELNKVLDAIIDKFEKQQKLDSLQSNTVVSTDAKKVDDNSDSKNGWYFYNT